MKKLTKFLLAGAFAACSAYASADPITVGGVTWDPDAPSDFNAGFDFVQDFRPNGQDLFGFGEIYSINGSKNFCSGCELTFVLDGFKTDGPGSFANQGTIKVYRDFAEDYDFINDPFNATTASGGDLWIEFSAIQVDFTSRSTNPNDPFQSGFLSVQWELGNPLALAFEQFSQGTQLNGSDAYSTGSATFDILSNGALGNGNLFADTVPAPTTLALFGLSILGIGALKRRRNA